VALADQVQDQVRETHQVRPVQVLVAAMMITMMIVTKVTMTMMTMMTKATTTNSRSN
jgi:hypothetical protein